MSRFSKAALFAVAIGGLFATGCAADRPGVQARYNDYVDTNWPDRYSYMARESVQHPHETQIRNALITDATISNYLFEPGTDVLTDAGRQRLDYLARRGQCVDGHLYLQTARDVTYDPKNPNKLVSDRAELDNRRSQSILAYMGAQPGGKAYDVTPIDPRDTNMGVAGPATAIRGLPFQYRSTLTGSTGLPLTGTGGGPGAGAPGVSTSGTAGSFNPSGGSSSSSSSGGNAPASGFGSGGSSVPPTTGGGGR